MGLASALSTALTGLSAAETQIDVVGNNLANSQTVGFKASNTVFATQFLQTLGLGSGPTNNTGGTNPRQTGLGTQVAEIVPDFTQGTIEISASQSDLAIQGDGFFIVEGATGERLFTRAGIFKTNADNELVTATGQRLLGFGVNELFELQQTQLVSLTIPLGSEAIAQATRNVFMEGILTPIGDIADTAKVIESAILGNQSVPRPDGTAVTTGLSAVPDITPTTISEVTVGGGTHTDGDVYGYRFGFVDNSGTESTISLALTQTITPASGNNAIDFTSIPQSPTHTAVNIYRTQSGGSDFFLLDSLAMGITTYTDDNSVALSTTPLNDDVLNGNYTYMVTHQKTSEPESRPSEFIGPVNVINGRLELSNFPIPPAPPTPGDFPAYDRIRIYRNIISDPGSFFLVGEVNPGETFTDNRSDTSISDLGDPANKLIDLDGPRIDANTLLTNVLSRDGFQYNNPFEIGTLTFSGRKGGRALTDQTFDITASTTVLEFVEFMEQALGIVADSGDASNPLLASLNNIAGETGTLDPGSIVQNGKIRLVSNNGVDNAVGVGLSAFELITPTGQLVIPSLNFGTVQEAQGESAVADFIAYDSLGVPLNVRLTALLETRDGLQTTYRWFADSGQNDPSAGVAIGVGTGLITFDGEGNLVGVTNDTVSIDRRNLPSTSPLEFVLDFTNVSGLSTDINTLAASRQDGSGTGTLASFIVSEDGSIRGVFTNGISRDLGRIRMARFSNPAGLEQRGQNLFASGANSGLSVESFAGESGVGTLVSGAVELSNTDIGQNLVELILASTQYRGNARVISTAQELLDELINLRR